MYKVNKVHKTNISVILVMNLELHWMDVIAGLEFGFFMEILNQYKLEDNGGSWSNILCLYCM